MKTVTRKITFDITECYDQYQNALDKGYLQKEFTYYCYDEPNYTFFIPSGTKIRYYYIEPIDQVGQLTIIFEDGSKIVQKNKHEGFDDFIFTEVFMSLCRFTKEDN